MGSSGVPREIYIIGVIVFMIVVNLCIAGFDKILSNDDIIEMPSVVNSDFDGRVQDINGIPLVPDVPSEATGLGHYVLNGFDNMPEWVNAIFWVLNAMIIVMLIILFLHC